jgi:predicted DNA-binding protein
MQAVQVHIRTMKTKQKPEETVEMVSYTLRLPKALLEKATEVADADDRSTAYIVKKALEAYLERK